MQGGHRDGINPVLDPGCNKKQEPMDIAYDSVSEISLSRTGDTVVESLRRLWIFLLATPVSWAHLEPTPQALRKRKFKKIREGTMVVLEVQRLCRNAVLDVLRPVVDPEWSRDSSGLRPPAEHEIRHLINKIAGSKWQVINFLLT